MTLGRSILAIDVCGWYHHPVEGHETNRQRTGSSVVGAGTTPRRTCGRRTGMATTLGTVTTTWAFAAPAHEETGWFLPEQSRVLSGRVSM